MECHGINQKIANLFDTTFYDNDLQEDLLLQMK